MKKGLNPKLDVGDRIILVHMDGEDVGPGTKGEVIKIEKYLLLVVPLIINIELTGLMMGVK